MGEAIGGVRAAFMRMLDAHVALLRAELEITGRELGIIAGLAFAAFAVAVLALVLLYVGSFLFFGEWLFGSMGWGIIHGTLVAGVVIAYVGLNLAGGDVRGYGWGALVGVIVTVVLVAVLVTNSGSGAFGWLADRVVEAMPEDMSLPFGEEWVATLTGLVIGAVMGLIAGLIVAWRTGLHGSARLWAAVAITILGAFVGALYASTTYQAPDGVFGFAIMMGLITWMGVGAWLTARRGFDPEARYADLVPRESIETFKKTKTYFEVEFERLKRRFLSR